MAGLPMPSPDLPDGTVTVRVIRGEITNNVVGVEVQLHGAGAVRNAKTGADGRAKFAGVPAGTTVRATTTVDGERLVSSEFQMPARGGIRTLLAAGVGAAPTAEPQSGTQAGESGGSPSPLSLGSNSRIALEFVEDVLQVFYLLEIVNRSGSAVRLAEPLTFTMPEEAAGTTVLEGSTRQAAARGNQVTVGGPFPPGATPVQIGYRIESFGDTFTLRQAFPVRMDMLLTAVQKVGDMRVSSPQITRAREVPMQNNTFIMGTGSALAAGVPLELRITGLPHRDRTATWLAVGLVVAIIASGAWLARSSRASDTDTVSAKQLQALREQGRAALAALETEHAAGRIHESQYEARRAVLLSQLERVYAELDDSNAAARRDVA
jgi:hypothetical protein